MFTRWKQKLGLASTNASEGSWLINFPKLFDSLPAMRDEFQNGEPYPNIVIEDLVSESCIRNLLAEFPGDGDARKIKWHQREANLDNGNVAAYKKKDSADFLEMGPTTRQLIWELNSRPFLQFLQGISGIPRIISDPLAFGGGLHETLKGGLLKVHADFQKHPIYMLDRRLNLILYLNKDWEDYFGGHLELWDETLSRCVKSIRPSAGRCAIFRTSSTSYHGHPAPLSCPLNRSRKSIALYYYTNGLGDEKRKPEGKTLWKDTP